MLTAIEPTTDRETVRARQAVYHFLHAAFDKPSAEQHAWFASPEFGETLGDVAEQFEVPHRPWEPAESLADHEARYIACFEVGVPAPPVPLLASHYQRREPVTAIIHEHILFYRRFGARLASGHLEPADHLLHELTFLIHLDDLLLAEKIETESLLRARRDFLRRHVTRWTPHAARAADDKHLPALYRTLLEMLAAAAAQDVLLTDAYVLAHEENDHDPLPHHRAP